MNPKPNKQFDCDGDGTISQSDVALAEQISRIELLERKDKNQVRLAWVAMISMIVVTIIQFIPWITDSRITSLKDTLDLFYIAQASVIGFYVGAKTYLTRTLRQDVMDYQDEYTTPSREEIENNQPGKNF